MKTSVVEIARKGQNSSKTVKSEEKAKNASLFFYFGFIRFWFTSKQQVRF